MGSYQTITTNFFMGNQLRCQAAGLLGMRRANNQVAPHCPHKVYIQKPYKKLNAATVPLIAVLAYLWRKGMRTPGFRTNLLRQLHFSAPTTSNIMSTSFARYSGQMPDKSKHTYLLRKMLHRPWSAQEKPNLTAEKLQWLQRHDKECGGLYGVLPLRVGMPVRATDHLDRKRGILKGTKGHVVGWSEIADETPAPEGVVCNDLPAVVYVKFETTTSWQIPGMPDSNVYPVAPCRRVWYLDRQRQSPKLRVSRTQCPLAPQFAITAHVAQGQTIKEGVMTDLCIGPMGNPVTIYVASTRIQGRGKLLIFCPFDAAPFQKGIGLGRDLLLRHLRGDAINWQALPAMYCEERVCSTCAERKQSTERLHLANGSAATLTRCVASAQNIMQMLEPRGNATCVSCGMSRPIFQKSIANGNVVFSVFV